MWLGGQTESFQNVGGGGGAKVYTMYDFLKPRGQECTWEGKDLICTRIQYVCSSVVTCALQVLYVEHHPYLISIPILGIY